MIETVSANGTTASLCHTGSAEGQWSIRERQVGIGGRRLNFAEIGEGLPARLAVPILSNRRPP
jgi:hypothetical protein